MGYSLFGDEANILRPNKECTPKMVAKSGVYSLFGDEVKVLRPKKEYTPKMVAKSGVYSWITEIHDAFLEDYGGLPSIRNNSFLISALEMPKASMFREKSSRKRFMIRLFHIVQNHPLIMTIKEQEI